MAAARAAVDAGIMEPVFIGEIDAIQSEARSMGWDISGYGLIETKGESEAAATGARLGNEGSIDAVMKGQLHTDTFMGALISKENGIRTHRRLIHLFYVTDPIQQKPLIISDAAVNVAPDIKTRQSAIEIIDQLARATGITRPKIAILSATETAIASIPSSMEAKELADWAKSAVPGSDVEGPLALDLVLSEESAKVKGMAASSVAGKADAIVVPDLVSGNAIFKALVYLSGGCAAGLVLGGKIPVLLTSRGDPPQARLASAALASVARSFSL